VSDHDEAGALPDGVDDRVGVLREARRLVIARSIHRHRLGSPSAELESQQVPVPGAAPAAVDQDRIAPQPPPSTDE
jgi:hypothetical protein